MDRLYDFLFDHRVTPEELQEGDHVYRWSTVQGLWRIPTHSHHGIVVEKNGNTLADIQIIEFMEDSDGIIKVRQVDGETFLEKGISKMLNKVQYQDKFYLFKRAGTSSPQKPLEPQEVVRRALSFLPSNVDLKISTENILFGAFKSGKVTRPKPWRTISSEGAPRPWNILVNNCECVARWCKVGEWSSDQATSYVHWISTIFVDLILAFFLFSGTTEVIAGEIEDELVVGNASIGAIAFGNFIGELIAGLLEAFVLGYAGMTRKDFRLHIERMIYRRLISFLFFTILEAFVGVIGSKFVLRLLFAHIVYKYPGTKDWKLNWNFQIPMFIKGNLVL